MKSVSGSTSARQMARTLFLARLQLVTSVVKEQGSGFPGQQAGGNTMRL